MRRVHGFACRIQLLRHPIRPYLTRLRPPYANALKTMHKAGRRGGVSIARRLKESNNLSHLKQQ
ncbi:hypothetical protein C5941_10445 [Cronobacter sakazakii]|nr:hypothetical protein C5941_10445 [Cronobacter sakazakii]PXY68720.1 hypothetical protein CDT90_011020 [Cronobacter sakazakii]